MQASWRTKDGRQTVLWSINRSPRCGLESPAPGQLSMAASCGQSWSQIGQARNCMCPAVGWLHLNGVNRSIKRLFEHTESFICASPRSSTFHFGAGFLVIVLSCIYLNFLRILCESSRARGSDNFASLLRKFFNSILLIFLFFFIFVSPACC